MFTPLKLRRHHVNAVAHGSVGKLVRFAATISKTYEPKHLVKDPAIGISQRYFERSNQLGRDDGTECSRCARLLRLLEG